MNLTTEVRGLYCESYEIIIEEMDKKNKKKSSPYSLIWRLLLKCPHYTNHSNQSRFKSIYRLKYNLHQNSHGPFYRMEKTTLIFIWKQKDLREPKQPWTERRKPEASHTRLHDTLATHSNTTDSKANGIEIQKQTCTSAANRVSQRH